ncbi:hypothetical protein Tco_0595456 [Tanacetum coccineum]
MRIPNGVQKRKGSFRFSNFITDKEFLPTVRSVWNKGFEGQTMYRVVQKMKALKRKLKQLSWKNGNVFEMAEELRIKLKDTSCKASVFLSSKQVTYEINKLLKGFLWYQGELTKGKAKVKWISVEKLKGRNTWEVQCDCNSSVGWKNILSLRDKARNYIWWKIGNGKSVNVWHDRWCPVSPLSEFIETRDVYDARLNNNCTISEIIHEGKWLWPEECVGY